MSCKSKKSRRKPTTRPIGDVTINDFANANKCTNRAKKGISSVTNVIKQLEIDNRSWDEKDDDYDGDFDFVEKENDKGEKIFVIQRRQGKKTINYSVDGVQYPLDIWFLISDYIRPEDVGRFARICKSTCAVINSARFWFKLYKRYYKTTTNLPERLQPECMVRLYGLKACVTRALFFMYEPFMKRIRFIRGGGNPYHLLNLQCVLMWHQKRKDKWYYYFKFKERMYVKKSKLTEKPDLIEQLEDVSANIEFGCRILLVTCLHFVPISPIMGLTLSTLSLNSSQGYSGYWLQLGFGSGLNYTARSLDVSTSADIVLDPITNVQVLDWWHPLYPHKETSPLILNQE